MREHMVSVKAERRMASVCALVQQFLIFYCFACTGIGLFYEAEEPLYYRMFLLLAVPMAYMAVVRKLVRRFFLCFLLHLPVLCAVVFVGQDFGQKTIVGACTIVMAVISLQMCIMEKGSVRECPSVKLASLLFFCYVFSFSMGHPICARYISYTVPVYILMNLIYESLSNTADYIHMHRDKENFPAGQMVIVNRIMVIVLLAVLTAGMLLFPMLKVFFEPLVRGFLDFLLWLLSFVHLVEGEEASERLPRIIGSLPQDLIRKNKGDGAFWVAVERVLEIAVVFAISVLMIGGIVYLLYRMYRDFYAGRKENGDEKEFLIGELRWFQGESLFKGGWDKVGEKSVNERIRKEYKRYVKRYFKKKESVPATLTPKELLLQMEKKVGSIGKEGQERIREIYEKARYGERPATEEEWEELRRLTR